MTVSQKEKGCLPCMWAGGNRLTYMGGIHYPTWTCISEMDESYPTFSLGVQRGFPLPAVEKNLASLEAGSGSLREGGGGRARMLVICRLRCTYCRKIHHELPSCIVPYKRYDSACVEQRRKRHLRWRQTMLP
ncbi:DUF6431 domain-containing protein [Paenibacillus cremeus]|uniref:DUF6431 domain-containing protein n=1 Tax=Paenibacillus cremeus TaxID=2163881 RepID=UPI0037049B45